MRVQGLVKGRVRRGAYLYALSFDAVAPPPPRSAPFSKRSPFRPARFLLLRMVTRTAVWIKLMRLCRASSVPQILSEKPLIIHPQVSAVSLVLEALRFSGSPVLACTHFIT